MARDVRSPLHRCRACGSPFVQVVGDPEQRGETLWRVELRCPECWHHVAGVFTQAECDELERALDAGSDALRVAVALLADERRERERRELAAAVERFVDALHAGHVLPEDFTPLTRARAAANPRPTRRTPP